MRTIKLAQKLFLVIPLLLLWACEEKENVDPKVKIATPQKNAVLMKGDEVPIKVIASDEDGSITEVKVYIDGEEVAVSDQSTYIYWWNTNDYEPSDYVLGALASDDEGAYDAANINVQLGAAGGLNPDLEYDTLTDIEGNVYATLELGNRVWMAENLKVSHYPDGTPITEITDEAQWAAMGPEIQAYSWYDNQIDYKDTYGALYTWAAAMNGGLSSDTTGVQGVCPDGWHLPTDAEWKALEMHLGMSEADSELYDWRGNDEGGQLKEEGFSKWALPNTGATNSSGLTAVPAGFRSAKGLFYNMENNATFWTATEDQESTGRAFYRSLAHDREQLYRHNNNKKLGLSVRCVKDQ